MEQLKSCARRLYDLSMQKMRSEEKGESSGPRIVSLMDYKARKQQYVEGIIESTIAQLRKRVRTLPDRGAGREIHRLAKSLDPKKSDFAVRAKRLNALISGIAVQQQHDDLQVKLPAEIEDDVRLDFEEIRRCLRHGCYRSSVILCGRVLETVLHRKYFDATGIDLLEKSPGIGLGKIIAKLKDKDIPVDPGLTQQIHLINQVRIHSVHKKQENFIPSKDQAQAMFLYTRDAVEKLMQRRGRKQGHQPQSKAGPD